MKPKGRIPLGKSIATRLLKSVFGWYLVIAVGITIGHMVMEYRYQKNNIKQNLVNIQRTFERPLAINVWNMDQESLESTVDGMLQITEIVGVKVQNWKSQDIAFGGIVTHQGETGAVDLQVDLMGIDSSDLELQTDDGFWSEVFTHSFPLEYEVEGTVKKKGVVTLYSNASVIHRLVKLEFFLLILNAILKTAALWIIFMWFSNRVLRRPLTNLTEAIAEVNLDNLGSVRVQAETKGRDELKALEESFNGMIGNLHESVIARKSAEEDKHLSEERYRSVYSTAPLAFILWDQDCKILDWNDQAESIFGWSKDEVLGKSFKDFLVPEAHQSEVDDIVDQLMDGKLRNESENQNMTKGGEVIWCHWHNSIQHGVDGSIIGALSLGLDVTQRKRAEAKLTMAQDYISNIIDSMPSCLIGVDADCNVTQMNTEAKRIAGLSPEQAIGRPLVEVFPHMNDELIRIRQAMESGKPFFESAIPRNEGNTSTFDDLTIYPLVIGDASGAVVRIDDATDRCELEAQVSQSRKMDAIGQMAGGIAHDFNNMLGAIIGAGELLRNSTTKLDEEGEMFVDMILSSAERAASLTKKLLTFGRKGGQVREAVDMATVVDDGVAILQRIIDKKVTVSVTNGAEVNGIMGDHAALQSVIINIGINAGHAMPDGGDITITTRNVVLESSHCANSSFSISPGNYFELEVTDGGCGIPEENLQKIFEPFFTTKEHGKGTGLGLAAAYGTIQDHHGELTVQSELELGSVFRIHLPCFEKAKGTFEERSDLVLGTGTILLVDDESVVRVIGEAMLQDMGYTVITADDGKEAVDLYRERGDEIDLVIMDMIMPVMKGSDAFRELMQLDWSCKVIIASGFTRNEDMEKLQDEGLLGFIQKPFQLAELSQLVACHLNA